VTIAGQSRPTSWQPPRGSAGPSADLAAFVLLLVGGVSGVLQYLIPQFPIGARVAGTTLTVSGHDLITASAGLATGSGVITRAAFVVAFVAGASLLLVALSALLPIDHRPLGSAGLVLSIAVLAAAGWLLATAESQMGLETSTLLSVDSFGWYLVVGAGLLGLVASIKLLVGS
jgi:hypothetical protein